MMENDPFLLYKCTTSRHERISKFYFCLILFFRGNAFFFLNLHQPCHLDVKIWMKETKPKQQNGPNKFRFHSFRLTWKKFGANFFDRPFSFLRLCHQRNLQFGRFLFPLCFRGFSQSGAASLESSLFIQTFRGNVVVKEQKGVNLCLQINVRYFFFLILR